MRFDQRLEWLHKLVLPTMRLKTSILIQKREKKIKLKKLKKLRKNDEKHQKRSDPLKNQCTFRFSVKNYEKHKKTLRSSQKQMYFSIFGQK